MLDRPRASSGLLLALGVLLCLLHLANASALTTTIQASERTCFYALVDKPGEKVRAPTPDRRAPSSCHDETWPMRTPWLTSSWRLSRLDSTLL